MNNNTLTQLVTSLLNQQTRPKAPKPFVTKKNMVTLLHTPEQLQEIRSFNITQQRQIAETLLISAQRAIWDHQLMLASKQRAQEDRAERRLRADLKAFIAAHPEFARQERSPEMVLEMFRQSRVEKPKEVNVKAFKTKEISVFTPTPKQPTAKQPKVAKVKQPKALKVQEAKVSKTRKTAVAVKEVVAAIAKPIIVELEHTHNPAEETKLRKIKFGARCRRASQAQLDKMFPGKKTVSLKGQAV